MPTLPTHRPSAMLLVLPLLAACGGGGGGGEIVAPGIPDVAVRDTGLSATVPALMPTAGRVRYDGEVGVVVGRVAADVVGNQGSTVSELQTVVAAEQDAIGTLRLEADFGTSAISGGITGLAGRGGTRLSGDLALDGGTISGNGFDVDAGGDLTLDGQTARFEGAVDGLFTGAGADGVLGSGTVRDVGTGTDRKVAVFLIGDAVP